MNQPVELSPYPLSFQYSPLVPNNQVTLSRSGFIEFTTPKTLVAISLGSWSNALFGSMIERLKMSVEIYKPILTQDLTGKVATYGISPAGAGNVLPYFIDGRYQIVVESGYTNFQFSPVLIQKMKLYFYLDNGANPIPNTVIAPIFYFQS